MFERTEEAGRLRAQIFEKMLDPVIEAVDNTYAIIDKYNNPDDFRYHDALHMEKEMDRVRPLMLEFIDNLSSESEFNKVSSESIENVKREIKEFKKILNAAEYSRSEYYDTDHLDILGARNRIRNSLHLIKLNLHYLRSGMLNRNPEVAVKAASDTLDAISDAIELSHHISVFQ